jgi:hypothetical protein
MEPEREEVSAARTPSQQKEEEGNEKHRRK